MHWAGKCTLKGVELYVYFIFILFYLGTADPLAQENCFTRGRGKILIICEFFQFA